jgi:hypothetical protein
MVSVLGYALMVLGLLIGIYGELRFLVVAYNRSLPWFFCCLFVPLADWLFLFLNLRIAARPFAISLVGLGLAALGFALAGVPLPG